MDATIKKLEIVPAHFDKNNEIDRDEYGKIVLDIPLDSVQAKEDFKALFDFLSTQFVVFALSKRQQDLPGMEASSRTQEATLSAADVENQLTTAKEAAD